MNFLSKLAFGQRVAHWPLVQQTVKGNTKSTPMLRLSGLPCIVASKSASEQDDFQARGSKADTTIYFPTDPVCKPGDLLRGEGPDAGREWAVQMRRAEVTKDVVRWVVDAQERVG